MDIAFLLNRNESTPALPDVTGSTDAPDTTHDAKSPFRMQVAGQLCQSGHLCRGCARDTSPKKKKLSEKEDEESSKGEEDTILDMRKTEQLGTLEYLETCGATTVKPTICARIRPFFRSTNEAHFTCYRRNYISCTSSFALDPYISDKPMQFTPTSTNKPIPIDQFFIGISAVSAHNDEEVELVQFNTTRDQSSPPQLHRLDPKPEIQLGEYAADCKSQHTFDRIQFRSASTKACHGKEDYYRFLVVLGAGIKQEGTKQWVKVATQRSAEIVVRGRTRSYFQKAHEDEYTSLNESARASG